MVAANGTNGLTNGVKLDPKKVNRPHAFCHVVLRTSQFENILKWWSDFLGADVIFNNGKLAFLSYDEEHHRLAIINVPDLKSRDLQTAAVDHVAFGYATLTDLMTSYKCRKQHNIEPYWTINHGMTMSMYYADPDKNRVECQVDNFPSAEEATAFMSTPDFQLNPIGIDYDVEDIMRRMEAGEDESSIIKRPGGPRPNDPPRIPGL